MDQTTHLRLMTLADTDAVAALNRRNHMAELDLAGRNSIWDAYPYASEFEGVPFGWVLTNTAEEIVGSLDNVHLLYEAPGGRVRGAVAAGWTVEPAYRSGSMQLLSTFFRQKGVQLRMVVSSSPTTSRLLTTMKFPRIPIPWYGTPCFWASNPVDFTRGALQKRQIRGAAALAWPAGAALFVRDLLAGSGRGRTSSRVQETAGFDERFDALWREIVAGQPRLRAVRDRAVLEWRFGSEIRGGQGSVVTAEKHGKLVGYAVLRKRDGEGVSLFDVADLQALGDSVSIFRDLLIGCVTAARERGVGAVKLSAGTSEKYEAAKMLRPHTYELPFWQQFYKADPDLKELLADGAGWDFSLFDTY